MKDDMSVEKKKRPPKEAKKKKWRETLVNLKKKEGKAFHD